MDNYQFFLSKLLEIQQVIAENVKVVLKLLEKYDQLLPIISRDIDIVKTDVDEFSDELRDLNNKLLQATKIDMIQNSIAQLVSFTNSSTKLFNRVYTNDELDSLGQFVVWIKEIHNFVEFINRILSKLKMICYILSLIVSIGIFIWVNWGIVSKLLFKLIN